MTDFNALFPSAHLKAADIEAANGALDLTIKSIQLEEITSPDGESEQKPVVRFVDFRQSLILNKTNAARIAGLHGNNYEGWIGKDITLITERVEAFGKIVPAIRVAINPVNAPQRVGMDPADFLSTDGPKPTTDELPF